MNSIICMNCEDGGMLQPTEEEEAREEGIGQGGAEVVKEDEPEEARAI